MVKVGNKILRFSTRVLVADEPITITFEDGEFPEFANVRLHMTFAPREDISKVTWTTGEGHVSVVLQGWADDLASVADPFKFGRIGDKNVYLALVCVAIEKFRLLDVFLLMDE